MRLPHGLQTAEATPEPETAANGDENLFVQTVEATWEQTVELGRWLGNFALNLAWAVVLIFVVLYVTGRLRRRLRAAMERRIGGRNNLPALIDNIVQIIIYVVAGAFALGALGADTNALVQSIGLVTAAISLSLQDVVRNFVAGLYLLAEQPFAVGDRIEVSTQVGTVERVNVRTTVLRNDKAEQVLVPNFQVFSQVVSNRTAYRLRGLTVAVAGIKEESEAALAAAAAALADLPGRSPTPPTVNPTKVGPEGCDIEVTVWTVPGEDLRREIVQRLRARFPDATLSITP